MIEATGVFANFDEEELFNLVSKEQGERKSYRNLNNRRTFRIQYDNKGYFVKHHDGFSVKEYIKNLISFKYPSIGAKAEKNAIKHLTKNHIKTLKLIAYGERGRLPFRQESFIITEELVDCISLAEVLESWLSVPPKLEEKRRLIELLASTVREMHKSGVNHQDCYLCHFLWSKKNPDDLYIIDLHRAKISGKMTIRWKIKDLAALLYSSSGYQFTKLDVFRFLKVYCGNLREKLDEINNLSNIILMKVRKIRRHTENLKQKRGFL